MDITVGYFLASFFTSQIIFCATPTHWTKVGSNNFLTSNSSLEQRDVQPSVPETNIMLHFTEVPKLDFDLCVVGTLPFDSNDTELLQPFDNHIDVYQNSTLLESVNMLISTHIYVFNNTRKKQLALRGFHSANPISIQTGGSFMPRLKVIIVMHMLVSGNVHPNPGPTYQRYPCSMCSKHVARAHPALECDNCGNWTHTKCADVSNKSYDQFIEMSDFEWYCPGCNIMRLNDSLFLNNTYDDCLSDISLTSSSSLDDSNTVPVPGNLGNSNATSSPKCTNSTSDRKTSHRG